jgi:hypothetical protein
MMQQQRHAAKAMKLKQEVCEQLYDFGERLGMDRLRTMKRQSFKLAILYVLLNLDEDRVFSSDMIASKATPYMQKTCPISTQQAARLMRLMNVGGFIHASHRVGDNALSYQLSDSFLAVKNKHWSEINEN